MGDLFNGWPEDGEPMTDLVKRLRSTRADMLGTDDEDHYWDCHEAAKEIERLIATCMADDALIKQQQVEIERLEALHDDILMRAEKLSARNAKLRAVVDAALKQDNPCDELIEALAALEDDDE